eukprot:TRINITY_DN15141_c0_g1_i1.p1 TRINITY_DN15141_c0_g1~~TRINITY_DN15141_c0_g1_i1.p1  ORF type:complete len:115 (-),score=5.89 TRINITY_DN15141_c0_g1_i1:224-568(-)
MLPTLDLFPAFTPWLFLFFTIVSVFTKPKLWPLLLILTLVCGLFYNAINSVALGVSALLFVMAFYVNHSSSHAKNEVSKQALNNKVNTFIAALVIIGCIALAAHLIPGFNTYWF